MALTRAYEEHEVPPEIRRMYAGIRTGFDLPFVPTVFKLSAGIPQYLKLVWKDLESVVCSREFETAARAFQEIAHSAAISGGWTFSDQPAVLAADKFSNADIRVIGGIVGLFARATAQMALFSRLMQRGYSGGQKGRVTKAKQVAAMAQMVRVHVPNEREAGLRVWLIYSDIKKTTGAKSVLSLYRALSPYPSYLASAWMDSKRLLADPSFVSAHEELNRRVRALLAGMPVRDHRALLKDLDAAQWRELEETVDGFARLLPQFTLLTSVWQRSFPNASRLIGAA
ncbi:MAG TPA: halocarboxylic acid dehydrogenase DehI family protein [Candidatus Angelobacter sp.]|nr:halocarboxylic acid dehydrogenase DehI family protein [Candidatus Angelobacter sp.]